MGPVLPAVNRNKKHDEISENLKSAVSSFASQYKQKQDLQNENEALKKMGIDLSGISDPTLRQELVKMSFQGNLKSQETASKLRGNQGRLRDMENTFGLPEGQLDAYADDPHLARQIYQKKEPTKTQAAQPIDADQLKRINAIEGTPEFQKASPAKKTSMLHKGLVSKENAKAVVEPYIEQEKISEKKMTREEGAIERSYKAQDEFIKDTTNSYKAFETDMKPRLMQMRSIPDEDLVGPVSSVFLDQLGIPLGALENPASELYSKLSQDLLKGLPETYGSRILKVEVDNFLKTIPTLMNSPEGRRMITSNMLKLGEMKEVYYNQMREMQKQALDENKPLPRDFQQEVFDNVKPQIDRINNEFVKMSSIKAVPKDTVPFFSPQGDIQFVPKQHAQWAQDNGGRRIW